MTRAGRFLATVALLVPAGLVLAGRAPDPSAPPEPSSISIDLIVTDARGRAIRDLKASDFELIDAGTSRPIEHAALASSGDGRIIAVFLDDYHVEAGESTSRARAALAQFADTQIGENDLVAVLKPLDQLNDIELSRGPDRLRAAIEEFAGRRGNYEARSTFERNFISRSPATADVSRAQVVSSALQALAMRIGAVREGRKSIVLVSEGFSPAAPRASDRLMGSLRAIVYAANRYGVAIYSIDPRLPDSSSGTDLTATTLQTLAAQTGGEAVSSEAGLEPGLKQAVTDLDGYYLLTYRPAAGGDGKFHPVEVHVKRPGAQVRVRSGYWASDPNLARRLQAANVRMPSLTAMRPPHTSPYINTWVGNLRTDSGQTEVIVAWEPGVAPPRNQQIGTVTLKATTDDGRVLFEQPVSGRATFESPPGYVQLEITVAASDGKRIDSDFRTVRVPDLRVTQPTFAPLQILRTRSAREFTAASRNPAQQPAASRQFSRTERLLIRVPVYGPNGTIPTVSATLLNRGGGPMRQLQQVTPSLANGIVQFDLPLSSLAPDDYAVELIAVGSDGERSVKTTLQFRVTD